MSPSRALPASQSPKSCSGKERGEQRHLDKGQLKEERRRSGGRVPEGSAFLAQAQCKWTGPVVLLHSHIEGTNELGLCPG